MGFGASTIAIMELDANLVMNSIRKTWKKKYYYNSLRLPLAQLTSLQLQNYFILLWNDNIYRLYLWIIY